MFKLVLGCEDGFQCNATVDGSKMPICIDLRRLCDGRADCSLREDEQNCTCSGWVDNLIWLS